MADKSPLVKEASFDDFAALYRFLRSPEMRVFISSGQAETLADIIDARLPASVSLDQRTPKGTIYAYLNRALFATVSQSGAVKFPKPRYIWNKPVKGLPQEKSA
jgi:hypothetical protein